MFYPVTKRRRDTSVASHDRRTRLGAAATGDTLESTKTMSTTKMNWSGVNVSRFGLEPQCITHKMHEHPLFSNAALARLIEKSARNNYYVNTMDITSHNVRARREGEIRDLSGEAAIDAVARGRLWIMLLKPEEVEPAYQDLVDELYAEMAEQVPGFKPYGQKMSILISSPNIQVYYHCDVPGQTLWQVRGNKHVYVYPNASPYIDRASLERIVLGESHEISMPYEESFDKGAEVYDLQPGQMLHWPLNAPHRIVNGNCLNVSFTTEHFTTEIRRSFVSNYANGVLRRQLGIKDPTITTAGPGYWAKYAVAGAWKLSGMQKKRRQSFKVDFVVDPGAPDCVRTIPAYEFRK